MLLMGLNKSVSTNSAMSNKNPCYDKFFLDETDNRYVCEGCGVDYPVVPRGMRCRKIHGVGSRLKELLSMPPLRIQIRKGPSGCRCLRLMRTMDLWGPDKCEEPENLAMCISQLQHEAGERNWPLASSKLAEWGAEWLIRKAISDERRRLAQAK